MKKLIYGGLIGFGMLSVFAFNNVYEPKNATAEVIQQEGLYIFTDSKPVKDYEYLGTVKATFSLGDSQYIGCRDRMIRKAKKDYPKANGIIITLKSDGTDKADAIFFK